MSTRTIQNTAADFAEDIRAGLTASPKYLPSKYFYDAKGDELFQMIMDLKEYYPTRCEYEILSDHKEEMLKLFNQSDKDFRLIEFGAGDGKKTKVLLRYFEDKKVDFTYIPIDISAHVLGLLEDDIKQSQPGLKVETMACEYFEALDMLNARSKVPKVMMFLGSSIGNFTIKQAQEFLQKLGAKMNSGDLLMIGFDLKKNPHIILDAYNDKAGVTKAFNLNLLERINEELGADFDPFNFTHFPTYDPLTGETKSFLVSRKNHKVYINALEQSITFGAWEPIYMELSQKYDLKMIRALAKEAGLSVKKNFFDNRHYFVNSVWTKE
jgi:dimethylhistidine N-methyltransferase